MKSTRLNPFQVLRDQLAIMSFYERFEQVVALVLSAVIAVIIVVSLFQLISIVFTLLVLDAFNPLDHEVFQSVFGMIMTLLIAMEFKHSIVRVALRRDSIIQVKTVILIGLIALATGIMSLAFAFSNMSAGGWSWRLFEGIVDVLFGLVMLIHPMISAALIPVIIGIWVFIRGLMYLIDALSWRRNRSRDWSGYAVIGVLLMVFGFLMIIDERFGLLPVAYLLAAIFLFVGFASLIVAFSMRRAKRETA